MEVLLNYSSIMDRVRRQVSLLAERLKDGEAYPMVSFSGIEGEGLLDSVRMGVSSLISEITGVIESYTEASGGVLIKFGDIRPVEDFGPLFLDASRGYVSSHVLSNYLSVINPQLAQRYIGEGATYLLSVKGLVFRKREPEKSLSDYGDIKGRRS